MRLKSTESSIFDFEPGFDAAGFSRSCNNRYSASTQRAAGNSMPKITAVGCALMTRLPAQRWAARQLTKFTIFMRITTSRF